MQGTEIATLVSALLVPVITAVAGGIGIVLRDRSATGRRRVLSEDAQRRMTLASEWWTTRQSVPSTPEELEAASAQVRRWLDDVADLITAEGPSLYELARSDIAGSYSVGRRLLLAYPFRRWTARLVRVAFYLDLIALGALALTTLAAVLGDRTGPADLPIMDVIGGEIIASVVLGLTALGLRLWAVVIEETAAIRRAAHLPTQPTSSAPEPVAGAAPVD
jgi:hypothetical protein